MCIFVRRKRQERRPTVRRLEAMDGDVNITYGSKLVLKIADEERALVKTILKSKWATSFVVMKS